MPVVLGLVGLGFRSSASAWVMWGLGGFCGFRVSDVRVRGLRALFRRSVVRAQGYQGLAFRIVGLVIRVQGLRFRGNALKARD